MRKIAVSMIAIAVTASAAFAFDDETNKRVLKDALVGAVTGYVAVAATNGDQQPQAAQETVSAAAEEKCDEETNFSPKRSRKCKSNEGHRPPGWDKGKKTGWDGADTPPGLRK